MDKIFILNQSYPNPESGDIGSPFVHVRAKYYATEFDVEVVKISSSEKSYSYEGIDVKCCRDYAEFLSYLEQKKPRAILCHFCEAWMNKAALDHNIPLIVWVHGSEAHSWYRILFTLHKKNIIKFARFIFINTVSLRNFRSLIKKSRNNKLIHFVFVSEWMKRITFFDTFSSTAEYSIIPNPIDTSLFKFNSKNPEQRKKILMIRSFNSAKYANDISIKSILKLSKKPYFKELEIAIYGTGIHWNKLTSKIKHLSNVKLFNNLLQQNEIPSVHRSYGVFLCPTRMDAQGVSMCEAMSSGLVPITSENTAIPEFVEDKITGFVTGSVNEIVESIDYLFMNPDKFIEISKSASLQITEKCGMERVISNEKELIRSKIGLGFTN